MCGSVSALAALVGKVQLMYSTPVLQDVQLAQLWNSWQEALVAQLGVVIRRSAVAHRHVVLANRRAPK